MPKPFAVFDIDGTLIRWQLYHAVVNILAKNGLLGEHTYAEIQEARMTWKQREHPSAFEVYESRMIRLYDQAITKITSAQFQLAAEQVLKEYKDQTYVYTRDLIRDLKQHDYFLIAISGSQVELVKMLAEYWHFDDYIGSRYQQIDRHYTGKKWVASQSKGKLLDALIKKHNLSTTGSIAVGDSASDISLLKKVELPIAFNPELRLYETAISKGWKIVIERKNVIYQLENRDGKYLLA